MSMVQIKLTKDEIDFLRKLSNGRSPAYVVRAMLRAGQKLSLDLKYIKEEKDLIERIKKCFKKNSMIRRK